jgi:nicotinamide-nucleotide amidase
MPERNQVQAMFPATSDEIFNPQGTAPGIDLPVPGEHHDARIFALPGVPAEMKLMFDETVAPRIVQLSGGAGCIQHLVMKFFGVGESDMEQRLGDMISRHRQPGVGITVTKATISLRITAMAASEHECKQLIEQTRAEILDRVGELHFGDGEHYEQYHAIDDLLCERGENLMVIELGLAAPLGNWFATLGATPSYRGGLSFANTDDLLKLTGCDDVHGALEALRGRFETDWILMVDAYPSLQSRDGGPLEAQKIRLVVITPDGRQMATNTRMGGHPAILQQRIGKSAMAWLRKNIATEQPAG